MKCLPYLFLLSLLLSSGGRAGLLITKDKKIYVGSVKRADKEILVKVKYGRMRFKLDRVKWYTDDAEINTCYHAGKLAMDQKNELVAMFLFANSLKREPKHRTMAKMKLDHLKDIRRGRKFVNDESELVHRVAVPETPDVADRPNTRDNFVVDSTRDELVRIRRGELQPTNPPSGFSRADYYAVYFAAGWSGACRTFTPKLVSAYHSLRRQYPGRVHFLLMSFDKSADDMKTFMVEDKITWGAVQLDKVKGNDVTRRVKPGEVPLLVIFGADGRILAKGQEDAVGELRKALAK